MESSQGVRGFFTIAGQHVAQASGGNMRSPPLNPTCSDLAPSANILTNYDQEHLVTYLRLLDADADGADWNEVARVVLHIDPSREGERAHRVLESHLARARWMMSSGYRHLLRGWQN
jgi:hypothetical protein